MVNPRICSIPAGNSDLGKRAVDLAAEAGLELDDWQAFVLEGSLRKNGDRWAAREVGLNVARQNGKNAVLEARELAELFLIGSEMTIHSAHQFDTSMEHFLRMRYLIEETPKLSAQLKSPGGVRASHGEEGFFLKKGPRLRFRTRTKSGGRGFHCDLLVLDEAMDIPAASIAALFPTKRARPNPQVWYVGSAVDQLVHEHGLVFAAVRQRGIEQGEGLAYFEWSVEGDNPSTVPIEVMDDPAAWAQANPALGIRISKETMAGERESLRHLPRQFAVELLGVGDWPRTDLISQSPIPYASWLELEDSYSKRGEHVCFGFDVSPERRGSIAVASQRGDGLYHVEVVEDRAGTAWLPGRLAELVKAHSPEAVVCDGYGPAVSLVPALEHLHVEAQKLTSSEHAQACAQLLDAVEEGTLRHIGQPELTGAVRAAATRPLGDAWAWSRKTSSANISPLVSCTLALSAAMTVQKRSFVAAWA